MTRSSALLLLLCLACSLVASRAEGATWFVAPAGEDGADGSLDHPFATVQRAQDSAAPGDTVSIRGGTYHPDNSAVHRKRNYGCITYLDKSGTSEKPITYAAYADEKPVFDCSLVKPQGLRVDAFYVSGSWLRFRGLDVTGVQVTIKGHTQSICFENDGNHNVFERITMHDGQAIGIYSVRGSDNLFLNCDAWNNWDYTSEGGRGGNVDGFGCHPTPGATGNVFRGCRAWFNSDDGYDCINAHESVTFENCWAMYNGLSTTFKSLGDGNGFKAGGYGSTPASELPNPIPRHTVRFCVAVGNKANGIYSNHHPGGSDWFNNSAYRNGANFNMLCRLADNRTDVDGFGHKLRNNLAFGSRAGIVRLDRARCDAAADSFDPGFKVTAEDFVSLDEAELFQPRQPNGDLPVITFLHPTEGSALIDAGEEIGFPFHSSRPDLGAFEH